MLKIVFSLHLVDLFVLNFHFDLVPPFYFLKWNRCFSGCENLPNSSCHFGKHKSIFLQILHQSSVPSNITPLYFFSSNIIYFVQKDPIKVQIFETFEFSGQNSPKFLMSIFKREVNSSASFASFFIVMTHNSSVNFKLIHFPLWIKGSHRSPSFKIFQVLWWKFAMFLMPFSKPQVIFFSSFTSLFSAMKDNSSGLF